MERILHHHIEDTSPKTTTSAKTSHPPMPSGFKIVKASARPVEQNKVGKDSLAFFLFDLALGPVPTQH